MTSRVHPLRAAALPLALAAAFPVSTFAQSTLVAQATLPPTTVTATRFAEPAQALPFGVSVVTAEEIRASGATNVNEALMRVLGVPGRQDLYGGGEYNLDLRGFGVTSDNNQVVILDGQRLSEADLGGTRLAGIPIDAVERIEVLRGSGAVLYGEGATAGVIVVTTKAGAGMRRTGATAYAAAGSFGLRDVRASGTLATANGLSLDASAQRRTADGHRDNFASRFEAGAAGLQWSGSGLRLSVRTAEDVLDTGLPGGISQAKYDANPRQTSHPTDHARIRNHRDSAFAQAMVGDWEFALDAGRRHKNLTSMNSGFAYDYDVDAQDYSLRARRDGMLGGARNVLVLGADRNQWQREVLGLYGSKASQRSTAWYAKDDVVLAGGTRISAGARTESIRKDSSPTVLSDRLHAWEFGASRPFTPALTAYARAGRSYRLANVDEFSYASPGAMLRPQVSRDLELGARWAGAASSVDARLYRSNVDQEIGYDPNATGPYGFPGANVNFDPTRRQGLEVDARHALTAALGLRLNAAWRDASFRSGAYAGKDVPLVPERTVALRADWTPAPGHKLSGGVNWVSSQVVDFSNSCSVPATTVADARYAFQWRSVELAVGVTNLFDRKYFTQAFGCAGGAPASIYPEAGRGFTASARISF